MYKCNFTLKYNIDNKEYIKNQETHGVEYYIDGQNINIKYNENDKYDITLNPNTKGGIIMIISGSIFLIVIIFLLYIFLDYIGNKSIINFLDDLGKIY